jgi:uncharacterized repeat protein (TIGR01451 family)
VHINEIRIDQSGTDNDEYFELAGTPATSLTGLTYLVIGDGTASDGTIEAVIPLTDSVIPSDGYFLAVEDTFTTTLGTPDLVLAPNAINFENSDNVTHMLVTGFTGNLYDDIDTDNDGIIDNVLWTSLDDCLALIETVGTGDEVYCATQLGPDGTYVPGHAYRCSAGWQIGSFSPIGATDTAGTANPCVDVVVDKTGPTAGEPGSLIEYTIAYSSTGVDDAHDVVISDTLDPGLYYVSDDSGLPCPACSFHASGTLTWTAGGVSTTQYLSFTLTAWATATLSPGAILTNTAEIATSDEESSTANNASQWPILISAPDLAVDKTGPEYAVIGEEIVYTIEVENRGIISATNVVLTDVLPISTTYASDDSGWACPACMPGATGPLTWTVGDVLSNTLHTFNLTVTVDPGAAPGAALLNEVEASTDAPGDNPANNSATWETEVYPLVTIHDIQYVPDPASDDESPYYGQVVWVEGVVVAGTDEIGYANSYLVIEEPAGGPWSGLTVYNGGTFPDVFEGDFVRLLGEVDEYYGMTQLSTRYSPSAQQVVSTGNPLPATEVISTGLYVTAVPTTSEPYESVLIEFRNATVTDADLGYGEWAFDDGSGATRANDFGENDGDLTYLPVLGDQYHWIRGIGWYSYDDYKLEPRYDADINLKHLVPILEKDAPTNVMAGETFTYTLTVENFLGYALSNVVVTDVVPANSELARILDGGQLMAGDVISWTAASLPDQGMLTFGFVVTATGSDGDEIWNDSYAAWADNWPTPIMGDPVLTIIGDYTPIYLIQGDGFESPYVGQRVKTRGVVSGFFEGNLPGGGRYDGFYIQDITGDGDTGTSDGILVNYGSLAVTVDIGHEVTVEGDVQEFNEYGSPCPECETQILVTDASDITGGPNSLLVPQTVIDPPGDPIASAAYFESLEGMFVTLPMTGAVVGPTNYGTIMVIPGDEGVSRVFRYTPQWGMPFGVRHYERYGEMGGQDAPNLIVGSVVTGTHGPLAYSFGNYIVATQEGAPWTAVFSAPLPITPTCPPPDGEQFDVLSFNVENFFDDIDDPGKGDPVEDPWEYELKRDKIAMSIAQAGCPMVVGFQEVEKLAALEYVAEDLWATHGCSYTAILEEGLDGRGIDVGYLTRNDRVTVEGVWQYQDCTTYDTGLGQGECPVGQQRLYSRIPLVMTATIQVGAAPPGTSEVVFIVNHLKSKLSRAGDPQSAMWRLLQAQSLAQLVDDMLTANPDLLLIVFGDLNDFEDSAPLEALYTTGGVTNTWFALPWQARYSYIYKGVSQILDHILVSPALLGWSPNLTALHINADLPHSPYAYDQVFWGTSDHDLVSASFSWPPKWTWYLPIITKGYSP